MKNKLYQKIYQFFNSGDIRTLKAKRHIIGSLFVKIFSIAIGLLLVRVALDYLDKTLYGVWLTLASFITWFSFFEIGLGNGLRNKLTEAIAKNDYTLGRIYVSTTYAILTIIISLVAIIFFVVNNFLDWSIILNVDPVYTKELSTVAQVVFGFFFLRVVFKIIGTVFLADQKPAMANALNPLANLIALILIYYVSKTQTQGSLLYLSTILSAAPVIIMALASIFFYSKRYRAIAPSIKYIRLKYARDLLNLGLKFFIIQISGLIMFQSSNIIIAQMFGPEEVTVYNVAYKLFSILTMVFSIIIMPYWSAVTDAWTVKDFSWIKKSMRKLLRIWIYVNALGLIIFVTSPFIFKVWLNNKVHVPVLLSLLLIIYFMLTNFGTIFNTFINGIGKIYLQLWSALLGAILFFPIAFLLIKYFGLGIEGLVIATICTNIYGPILAPIQYKRIISQSAKGIWAK